MKRQMIRLSLALLVVLTTALAALVWTAEYDSHPDPKALFKIEGVQVKRDRGNRWINVHLERAGDKKHDMRKQVVLLTADGVEHKTYDITFAGSPETGFTDIWLKFWLEEADLENTLKIRINDGVLLVKTNQGAPELENAAEKVFKSTNWGKSWLGF
jgi:hypothetical protein